MKVVFLIILDVKIEDFTEDVVDDKEAFVFHFKQKLAQSANRYLKRSRI